MTDIPQDDLLKDEPLGRKLLIKWWWAYLFSFVIAPTWYIIKVLVSNSLSVEDVWVLYSIIWFFALISAYNDLWLTAALRYFLPRYRIQKQYNSFTTATVLSVIVQLLSSVLISMVILFNVERLATSYFKMPESAEIISLFCLFFLGFNLYQVLFSVYNAFQDIYNQKLIEFIRLGATALFTVLVFFSGQTSISWFAACWVIGLFVSIWLSWYIFFSKYKRYFKRGVFILQRSMLREYVWYALRTFIWANAWMLLWKLDQQMIIYFLWPRDAWIYTNYLSLFGIVGIITTPIIGMLLPILTELLTKWEMSKFGYLQTLLYKHLTALSVVVSGMFIALWPILAVVLFWTKFADSWIYIQYTAYFLLLQVLMSLNSQILGARWMVREQVKIVAGWAIFNIISNYLLIPSLGITGAITTTILWWIGMFWFGFYLLNKRQHIKTARTYRFKNMGIVAVLVAVLSYFSESIFTLDNTARYSNLLYLVIVWLVYSGIIVVCNYSQVTLLIAEMRKLKQ